jgi:outer membrane protein assembly factor BamB
MRITPVWVSLLLALPLAADDWPEWRGRGRLGVWRETGILDRFPEQGLKVRWRTPLRSGWTGPAVAQGRVFVADFTPSGPNRGRERALALDEAAGRVLWTRDWEVDYTGLQSTYATGPRATPTVDGDRVYYLGAKGALWCLNAVNGDVVWKKDFVADYQTQVPVWGMAGAPLVDGDRLIAVVGGQPDAKVMAFDKRTGREVWRALPADSEPGYVAPVIVEAGGRRQLIIWHATALAALDPASGRLLWEHPYRANNGLVVATPVSAGPRLFITAFYNGPLLLDLSAPTPRLVWKGSSSSEIKTDGLHSLISTPVLDGDYIYGICSYGQLRGLNAKTGERLWETLEATREQARWSTGHIVRHADRYFINNDRGELILARLTPQGYQEISRTELIRPTSKSGNRRERGAVNWSHPAYANRHIFARNDEEILSASLGQE